MNRDDVLALTRRVTTLGSWTEAATEELMAAISRWTDRRAAEAAVDELVGTWDTQFRPPLARLLGLYRSKVDAYRMIDEFDRPRPSFRVPTMAEGRAIAWRSYEQDCHDRGIPVSQAKFDAFMSSLGLPKEVSDGQAEERRTKGPGDEPDPTGDF